MCPAEESVLHIVQAAINERVQATLRRSGLVVPCFLVQIFAELGLLRFVVTNLCIQFSRYLVWSQALGSVDSEDCPRLAFGIGEDSIGGLLSVGI